MTAASSAYPVSSRSVAASSVAPTWLPGDPPTVGRWVGFPGVAYLPTSWSGIDPGSSSYGISDNVNDLLMAGAVDWLFVNPAPQVWHDYSPATEPFTVTYYFTRTSPVVPLGESTSATYLPGGGVTSTQIHGRGSARPGEWITLGYTFPGKGSSEPDPALQTYLQSTDNSLYYWPPGGGEDIPGVPRSRDHYAPARTRVPDYSALPPLIATPRSSQIVSPAGRSTNANTG